MNSGKRIKVFLILTVVFFLMILIGVGIAKTQDSNVLKVLIVGDSIGEGAGASDPTMKWYKYLIPYMKDTYGVKLDITNVSMGGNTSYAGYVRVMELDEK